MRTSILMLGFVSVASAAQPEWTLVWQDDFNRSDLGPDWREIGKQSQTRVADGRLEIYGKGRASVISARAFPPDVRFEFDGGVLPGQPPCDLSPALCCNEWWGRACGYHLAFGSSWGKQNVLLSPRGRLVLDDHPAYRLEANKRYHMVAIKEGARVSLSADDHLLLSYDDPDPLGGPGFDRIAITTWSGVWVDNVRVYAPKSRSVRDVPWLVKLPPLPLTVTHGRMAAGQGVDAREVAAAIEAFNAGDLQRAYELFIALPDSLLKAAGLAGCLGHLDYEMEAGQGESLAELFLRLADAAPQAEQTGLRACALAARLRDDEKRQIAGKQEKKQKDKNPGKTQEKQKDVRCSKVNGLRLMEIGPENNPYYWRARYDIARFLYWTAAEGNDAGTRELSRRQFSEILSELPDHSVSRQYTGQQVPWGPEFSQRPQGTPVWAAALREAYGRNAAILEWWIKHRQKPDGTLGGGIGDDVEIFRSWQPLAAISTGTPVVREGIARLCDGVWNNPAQQNGLWGGIMDVEHGAEYTADTQPVMVFLDYGEPGYYERNLLATRQIREVLTGVNQRGKRQFKSIDVGGKGVGDVPEHQADVPYHARAMKAVMWLAWAGNPAARELFLDWSKLWLDAAMSQEGGKPAGVVPVAVWYPSGSIIRPSGKWWEAQLGWTYYEWPFSTFMALDAFNCAYYFTHDPTYLIPMQRMLDLAWSSPRRAVEGLTTGSPEWVTAMLQAYPQIGESIPGYRWVSGDRAYDENLLAAARDEETRIAAKAYVRYLIDHDLDAFGAAIEKQTESRRYNFELQTREVLATDRAGIPVDDIFGAYTGAARRWSDMGLPSCAVTWVAEDTTFAALVQATSYQRLKLKLYQFKDKPVRLGMRLWQLVPGRYELVAGPEEESASGLRFVEAGSRTFDLRYRGQIEYVDVPPRRTCSVDVRLVQPAPPAEARPDLAVGREDVTVIPGSGDNIEVKVRVHNIGSADAGPARVALFAETAGGKPLAETALPPIPAPNDLSARYHDVRLEASRAALAQGWRVEVQVGPGSADSNPLNNTRSGRLP